MNTIKIYGASDDLIEVEDAENGNDEFGAYSNPKYLRFNDGTRLKCEYAPEGYGGNWKIEVAQAGTAKVERTPVDLSLDEADPHSDVLVLTGDGLSVTGCGQQIEPTVEEYCELLEDFDPRDYSGDQLQRIYAITKDK